MIDKLNGYALTEVDELLEKYNITCNKFSIDMKKRFDSVSVYNKNYLKTKMKSHTDELTDFYNKKIPKVDSNHKCLAVVSLDSVLMKDEIYYPQVFSKESKYIEKELVRHIHDNLSDLSHSFHLSEEE